jgi:phage shock protein E
LKQLPKTPFKIMKLTILLVFIFSLSIQAQTPAVQHLQPADFVAKLKATKNAQMLDVRTPEEWAQGKLASANCANFMDSSFKQQLEKLDKSKPVFVYCAAGGRSTKASKILEEAGFKQIFNLQGGGFKDLSAAQIK